MAEVELSVEGKGRGGPLQEGGEALLHQLHEEDLTGRSLIEGVGTKVLNDVWVCQCSQQLTLLMELLDVLFTDQHRVEQLGRTQQLIAQSLAYHPIGPTAQLLVLQYLNVLERAAPH